MSGQNGGPPRTGLSEDQINAGIQYVKQNATTVSDTDRRVWELVTDVPKLSIPKAYACALLNLLFSGIGTMASAFLGEEKGVNKTQLIVGFIQLLTSVYLVGWFLSIYWAYKLIMKCN